MKNKSMPSGVPPSVSVLVTVYNRESFLAETLESILNSTWQEFEVVVVDDKSSDNSLSIAREFEKSDVRIRVYRNNHNLGDYNNRNKAASLAKGKYLKFLDADDLIYKHSLAIMLEALEQHPNAALGLSSNVIDPQQPYPNRYTPVELFRSHYLGASPLGVGPSAAIIRRECFEAVGGFSGRQFVGDSELWLKLAERWPVVTLPPSLVWWRRHEGQQMNLELKKPEILDIRYQMEFHTLAATKLLSESEKFNGARRLRQHHSRRILALALRKNNPRAAWSLFRRSGMTFGQLIGGFRRYAV